MRARDYPGFPLLAVGISGVMLGHHWLGPVWFWPGVAVSAVGLLIISSGGLQERIAKALRTHRGSGDHGDRHFHGGPGDFHAGDSGGGDGGDGDGD
jgi:hypothetical protein